MALSDRQKIAIRRHLGVPFSGTADAGRLFGWRFAIHNEDLEYKMLNMKAAEEVLLTGNSLGSWRIDGFPSAGDVLTFTLNDGTNNLTMPYTVLAGDLVNPPNGSKSFAVALKAALVINAAANQYGYQTVAIQPGDSVSQPMIPSYYSELQVVGPSANTFTLGLTRTGTTNAFVLSNGIVSPVTATVGSTAPVTLYGYIAICDYLAMLPIKADLSLWLTSAEVGFRRDEVAARHGLYAYYCEQMSKTLGGREYVNHFGGRGGGSVA